NRLQGIIGMSAGEVVENAQHPTEVLPTSLQCRHRVIKIGAVRIVDDRVNFLQLKFHSPLYGGLEMLRTDLIKGWQTEGQAADLLEGVDCRWLNLLLLVCGLRSFLLPGS